MDDCSLIREKYYLYVGRRKGTMDLVEGYRKAKTGEKACTAGPPRILQSGTAAGTDDPNIIMTDYVVGDPLKELFTATAGCSFCPATPRTFSFLLLEALSIGARCLVSDIPENTVVTDIYGVAFTPEDTDDLARALERECAQGVPGRNAAATDRVRPYKF